MRRDQDNMRRAVAEAIWGSDTANATKCADEVMTAIAPILAKQELIAKVRHDWHHIGWLALGISVGIVAVNHPTRPRVLPNCADEVCYIDHTNIRTDDDHGVHITITISTGEYIEWSVYPDEARQMAQVLNQVAATSDVQSQPTDL
jgi:hypothetical protein